MREQLLLEAGVTVGWIDANETDTPEISTAAHFYVDRHLSPGGSLVRSGKSLRRTQTPRGQWR